MKKIEPSQGASPPVDQDSSQKSEKSAGHGGKRDGAGAKFDPEVWKDGGTAEWIKRWLALKLGVNALRAVLRGQTKDVRKMLKPYMSRQKVRQALSLLESVVDADNRVMWKAVTEVAAMCGNSRVAQEAHRAVAGVEKVPHGEIMETSDRDTRLKQVKQRAEQTRKRAPPDEVQIEWIRRDREEMIRLMKEQDPDAPVGVAMEPIDPALQFPPAVYWPVQPFRQMCVDPDCEHKKHEHIHCRNCERPTSMYYGPDPTGPHGEEVLGLCEHCFLELIAEKQKSRKK
jgi:hypothetical protein